MKLIENRVSLTEKEAETIMDMLFTKEGEGCCGGDSDEEVCAYDEECKEAGKIARKIEKLLKK